MKRVEVVWPGWSDIFVVVDYLFVVVVVFQLGCWSGKISWSLSNVGDGFISVVTVNLVVVISHQAKQRTSRNKYDDDVAGARRLECGGASGKFTPRSSGEADRHCATESLGGLNCEGHC
jgi:hypothetical protein